MYQGCPDYIHGVDLSYNLAVENDRRARAVAMRKRAPIRAREPSQPEAEEFEEPSAEPIRGTKLPCQFTAGTMMCPDACIVCVTGSQYEDDVSCFCLLAFVSRSTSKYHGLHPQVGHGTGYWYVIHIGGRAALDSTGKPAADTLCGCSCAVQADFSLDGKNPPISIQHLNRGHCTACSLHNLWCYFSAIA